MQFKVKQWKKNALQPEPGSLLAPVAQPGLPWPSSMGALGRFVCLEASTFYHISLMLCKAHKRPCLQGQRRFSWSSGSGLRTHMYHSRKKKSQKEVGISFICTNVATMLLSQLLGGPPVSTAPSPFPRGCTEPAAAESTVPPAMGPHGQGSLCLHQTPSREGPINTSHT